MPSNDEDCPWVKHRGRSAKTLPRPSIVVRRLHTQRPVLISSCVIALQAADLQRAACGMQVRTVRAPARGRYAVQLDLLGMAVRRQELPNLQVQVAHESSRVFIDLLPEAYGEG